MKHLSIDIETYSSVDIKKSGLYRYVQSEDFEILLFAYSADGGEVRITDLKSGETIPFEIKIAMLSPEVQKHAYNAAFEWYCLSKYLSVPDPILWLSQWRCTMLHGLYCGYPGSLSSVGSALGMKDDKKKMAAGRRLIDIFCKPCKPTKTNAGRTRTLPHHEPEKWELFKEYCKQDVVTEMETERMLSGWPVPKDVQEQWELDIRINSDGVAVDLELVNGALYCSEVTTNKLMSRAVEITGLDNPNSDAQLKKWIEQRLGKNVPSLDKKNLAELLPEELPDDVREVLKLRKELGKTSVTKYSAIDNAVCDDGRVRGLLQFYGANRTGRWAGRLVQVQNLPRNYLENLSLARDTVKKKNPDGLGILFGSVPDTLSQLIRTAFIPAEGNKFVVADFSAIEARVIAWLAGEEWRQEVFRTHGKIYEASASAMFGIPIEKIKKGTPEYALRAKGKVAELALGYQGSSGALVQMGALDMGLAEEELPDIVRRWRSANKRIVALWYAVENAAIKCMRTAAQTGIDKGIIFSRESDIINGLDFLTVTLPSGRKLFYAKPYLAPNRWGNDSLHYQGMDQTSKKWCVLETYGGKLVENIVQAVARDCLAVAMQRLTACGYRIVMHIHDEAVIDCPQESADLDKVCSIMCEPISWADGLLLKAAGFVGDYYMKD